jgi:hypothetical protein
MQAKVPLILGASLVYMGNHTVYAGDYDSSVNQPAPSGVNPGQDTDTHMNNRDIINPDIDRLNNPDINNLNKSYPTDSDIDNSKPPNPGITNQDSDTIQRGNTDPGGHNMMRNAIPGSDSSVSP